MPPYARWLSCVCASLTAYFSHISNSWPTHRPVLQYCPCSIRTAEIGHPRFPAEQRAHHARSDRRVCVARSQPAHLPCSALRLSHRRIQKPAIRSVRIFARDLGTMYRGVSAIPRSASRKFCASIIPYTSRGLPCFSNTSDGKPRASRPERIFRSRGFTPSPKRLLTVLPFWLRASNCSISMTLSRER